MRYSVLYALCLFLHMFILVICTNKPNIVIFLADDLGYGDLQAYGDPLSDTPNIDVLFRDGLKLTQLYSAAVVCSPARAGLLTGRYPIRHGFWNTLDTRSVLRLNQPLGLPLNETTIAELLKEHGYKSAFVGKWHLGVGREREFLPRHHGFDHFFGIPVSLDLCGCSNICFAPNVLCEGACSTTSPQCPLFLEEEIIEQPVDLPNLAERQVVAAKHWINEFNEEGSPFLLMYWFVHPHTPHFASPMFRNSTLSGQYTDSLAELDWQVGQVISTIKEIGQFDDTMFLFTSDNGPAESEGILGGSSGPFRCGKFSTYEGGTRVPGVVFWHNVVPAGISREFISHLDIWPTLASIADISSHSYNLTLDGFDVSNVFFNNGKSPRSSLLYFNSTAHPQHGSFAVRYNQHKAHYITYIDKQDSNPNDYDDMCQGTLPFTRHNPPLVYDLLVDPEESTSLNFSFSSESTIRELQIVKLTEESRVSYGSSIVMDFDDSIQACCNKGCEPFPKCCVCVSNYSNSLFAHGKVNNASSHSSIPMSLKILVILLFITIVFTIVCSLTTYKRKQSNDYIDF